jgi:hypothetical protein
MKQIRIEQIPNKETEMTGKNVLYAAVGAPVVAARKVAEAVTELRSSLNKEADTLGKTANKRVALWANEGEKLVNKITDAKMVDELTSKVDFDQVSTQVSKLRDQLEDMLATWRASFRPEKLPTVKVEASPAGVKLETKKSVAKKPAQKRASKKAASQKAAAKKAPAKAKKSPAKSTVTAKVTGKSPSTKKASARKASSITTVAKKANSTARKSVAVAS